MIVIPREVCEPSVFNAVEVPDWALDLYPKTVPGFRRVDEPCLYYLSHWLKVICSAGVEADGKRWMHVSVSHRRRLPNWREYRLVKDLFIGKHRKAIQVLPAEAEYVNHHPNVLHLWSCLDGDPLPDFRRNGTI